MSMENFQQETSAEKQPIELEAALSSQVDELGPAAVKKGKAGLAAALLLSITTMMAGCAVDKNNKIDVGRTLNNVGEWLNREAHDASARARNQQGVSQFGSEYSASASIGVTGGTRGFGLVASKSEQTYGQDQDMSKNPFKNNK